MTMRPISKSYAAAILRVGIEDVSEVLRYYGIPPFKSVKGEGGYYLEDPVKAVRKFIDYSERLEKELLAGINQALAHPVGLELCLAGIRKDIANSEAPQTIEGAVQKWFEKLDAQVG